MFQEDIDFIEIETIMNLQILKTYQDSEKHKIIQIFLNSKVLQI